MLIKHWNICTTSGFTYRSILSPNNSSPSDSSAVRFPNISASSSKGSKSRIGDSTPGLAGAGELTGENGIGESFCWFRK